MNDYMEKEIKVLDVNVEMLRIRLEKLGAILVYDDVREISSFDFSNGICSQNDLLIRLTKENAIKITVHINNSKKDRKIIKIHPAENETICKDFLLAIGLEERTRLISHRVSYEWQNVDFDIDQFPGIPPFLEIDLKYLNVPLKSLLKKLSLETNKIVECGTESIFEMYGIDYYEYFKLY